ncbi:unnamed protein product [Mucor fragilis]
MFNTVIRRSITTTARRHYVATPQAFHVFNREAKKLQKDRAAMNVQESRTVDYLKDEIAARVADRLLDISRDFDTVVDLGSGCGHIVKHATKDMMKKLIMCDMSEKSLNRDKDVPYEVEVERQVVDEEHLPFAENSLDAVVSSLSLNWVNDLPGALIQIKNSLKPDGVFIGAMFGGDTLFELRTSLQLAEVERKWYFTPYITYGWYVCVFFKQEDGIIDVSLVDSSDMSRMLTRAGFTLTTVDVDEIQVNYPSAFELMQDLRAMGESNSVLSRRPFLKRDTLMAAASIYQELHGNPDGSIPATFSIIYLIGWKPSESTPLPKKRGSANASLKDVLEEKK